MTGTMTFRCCTDSDLSDVLAKLEGQTINVLDYDDNIIGQVILGPRIHTGAPRINAHAGPDARVIGA